MTILNADLRQAIESAVLAEHRRVGPEAVRVGSVWRQFEGKVGRSTLYRVADDYVKSGRCGAAMTEDIRRGAERRAEAPAAAAVADGVTILPRVVTAEDITGRSPMKLIERLQQCIVAAEEIMVVARGTEAGKVRNAGLMLKAINAQRGCLQTATQMLDAMHRLQNIERFHAAVIDTIASIDPVAAEKIVVALRQTITDWQPSA